MEGVMMKNKDRYAVSVRLQDKSIVTDVKSCTSVTEKYKWLGLPFIRGSVNLVESLIIGMKALTYSANFFDDEEDEKQKDKSEKKSNAEDKQEEGFMTGWVLFGTMVFSIILAAFLFMLFPQLLSESICKAVNIKVGGRICALIEGLVRLMIFILYIKLISLMEDIERVYMYHGAEHKCINCIEHGKPLTVDNVRSQSKEHKRCGTSFVIIVLIIAVFIFMFIPPVTAFHPLINFILRFVVRIVMLPVIAGISYEFLRLAGRSDSKTVNILSKPGLWMQGLTTLEPTDDMIEVAIASVEAVYDWKKFLADEFGVDVEK